MQKLHSSELEKIKAEHVAEIDALSKQHMKELLQLEPKVEVQKVIEVQEKIVEVVKEPVKPETSEVGTQTDMLVSDMKAEPVDSLELDKSDLKLTLSDRRNEEIKESFDELNQPAPPIETSGETKPEKEISSPQAIPEVTEKESMLEMQELTSRKQSLRRFLSIC